AGFLGDLLGGFARSFEPIEDSLVAGASLSAFMAEFGWYLDPGSDVTVVRAAFGKLPDALASLSQAIADLNSAGTDDAEAIGRAVEKLATVVKDVVDTVHALAGTTPNTL